ncbi:MAG: hypothetical protein ACMUHX_08215 [bacterium]
MISGSSIPYAVAENITINMNLPTGWSMISLPVLSVNPVLSEVFPGAQVVYGYKKGSGYVRVSEDKEMEAGSGYWILLNKARTFSLTGMRIDKYNFPVGSGWYMVGGCSSSARVLADNCKIVVVYEYDPGTGYKRVYDTSSLDPSKGYWILFDNINGDQAQLDVERIRSFAWKLSTTPTDVINFLNGNGAYGRPVLDAKICVYWDEYPKFYIFYQYGDAEQSSGNWGWKLSTTATDVINFLNGKGSYEHPVTTARIAAMENNDNLEFYVFYKRNTLGDYISNWTWKLSTDTTDAKNYLNGNGAYSNPIKGGEICSIWKGSYPEYYIFPNKGPKIWVQTPLVDERFVKDEAVKFRAIVTGDSPMDGSKFQWISSVNGFLGNGSIILKPLLSLGNQNILVKSYGLTNVSPVRIFDDLWELYQSAPSQGEINRIMDDFNIYFNDGTAEDEKWGNYGGFIFDQESTDPSKIVAICKLDILRHQQFAEPPPFTGGKTVYEHVKTHVQNINLYLSCGYNTGGGGSVNLRRNFSVWDGRVGWSESNPDGCKTPFTNPQLYEYISPLYLLIHECRHNEPDDSGHISCIPWNPASPGVMTQCDPSFEDGSGHSRAALYLMWIYKYGLYDSLITKNTAKSYATGLLKGRFCEKPVYDSNPLVQNLLVELIGDL